MSPGDLRVWRDIKHVLSLPGGELLRLDCGHSVHVASFPDGRCERSGIGLTRAWCTQCSADREIERLRARVAQLEACGGSCGHERMLGTALDTIESLRPEIVKRNERIVELTAKANELPGLTAALDELFGVIDNVRAWLQRTADNCTISEHDHQELASILSDVPTLPISETK